MNKKAFTLIELLVVIAIIGVLSGLVMISMNGATDNAKDTSRKNDINNLRGIILANQSIEDVFPIQATECEIGNNCTNLHSILVPDHFATLSAIPKDPSGAYYKYQSTNGTDFTIKSTLSTAKTYQYNYLLGFSEEVAAPNSNKAIASFNFATPSVTGVVNESAKTVSLTVPYGTNVTALVPTITITGSSISPASGVARNFTSPVTYTVTAADSTTQAYVVTVTIAPQEE